MKNTSAVQRLMDEPIGMPGFYGLTVTREFAFNFLKACGHDVNERGFGSLDYLVFAAPLSNEPLTPLTDVFRRLSDPDVMKMYQRGE